MGTTFRTQEGTTGNPLRHQSTTRDPAHPQQPLYILRMATTGQHRKVHRHSCTGSTPSKLSTLTSQKLVRLRLDSDPQARVLALKSTS